VGLGTSCLICLQGHDGGGDRCVDPCLTWLGMMFSVWMNFRPGGGGGGKDDDCLGSYIVPAEL
jgi:hypothetical protein